MQEAQGMFIVQFYELEMTWGRSKGAGLATNLNACSSLTVSQICLTHLTYAPRLVKLTTAKQFLRDQPWGSTVRWWPRWGWRLAATGGTPNRLTALHPHITYLSARWTFNPIPFLGVSFHPAAHLTNLLLPFSRFPSPISSLVLVSTNETSWKLSNRNMHT